MAFLGSLLSVRANIVLLCASQFADSVFRYVGVFIKQIACYIVCRRF